jgi:hypothetical protein
MQTGLATLTISPTEAFSEGPVNEPAAADDVFLREFAPGAGIGAVQRVVAHGHVMAAIDFDGGVFVGEDRSEIKAAVLLKTGFSVHVADVGEIFGESIERVNHFEMACGGVERFAVDDEMLIVADTNFIFGHADESFDVELILMRDAENPFGFENDDFTALWMTKVVSEAIDEQVIACDYFEFEDVLAF